MWPAGIPYNHPGIRRARGLHGAGGYGEEQNKEDGEGVRDVHDKERGGEEEAGLELCIY